MMIEDSLKEISSMAQAAIAGAATADALEVVRVEYLGRNGQWPEMA